MRAIAYDGKYHPVDSKEIAFVTAGREAFLDAVSKARPIVLEPIVNLDVRAPADCVGTITGDLSSRRGRISSAGTDAGPRGLSIIKAQVPLAELEGYESQLKSMTWWSGLLQHRTEPLRSQCPAISSRSCTPSTRSNWKAERPRPPTALPFINPANLPFRASLYTLNGNFPALPASCHCARAFAPTEQHRPACADKSILLHGLDCYTACADKSICYTWLQSLYKYFTLSA